MKSRKLLTLCVMLVVTLLLFTAVRHMYNYDETCDLPPLCINTMWDWFVEDDASRIINAVQSARFDAYHGDIFSHPDFAICGGRLYFVRESPFTTFSHYFQPNPRSTFHELIALVNHSMGRIIQDMKAYHGDDIIINYPIFSNRLRTGINWDWESFVAYLETTQPHMFHVRYRLYNDYEWSICSSRECTLFNFLN